MTETLADKIKRNPFQTLAFTRRPAPPIALKDLQSGRVQFATVMFKPDSVAAHRTWEGVRYMLERLREQGFEDVQAENPMLFFPNAGEVTAFYNGPQHKPHLGIITNHLTGLVESDPAIPQAGMVAFLLVARNLERGQNLIRALRGEDGKCGIMGPTYPETAVTKGEVRLEEEAESVRAHLTVESGGETPSKVLNATHGSDSGAVDFDHEYGGAIAAAREAALIFGRQGLEGYFEASALSYLLGEQPVVVGWKQRLLGRRVVFGITPAQVLRFPLYAILESLGLGRPFSWVTEKMASFLDPMGFNPRDMQQPDIELLLRETAEYMAGAGLVPAEFLARELGHRPAAERPEILILVGASGSGKTTQLAALHSRSERLKMFVEDVSTCSRSLRHYIDSVDDKLLPEAEKEKMRRFLEEREEEFDQPKQEARSAAAAELLRRWGEATQTAIKKAAEEDQEKLKKKKTEGESRIAELATQVILTPGQKKDLLAFLEANKKSIEEEPEAADLVQAFRQQIGPLADALKLTAAELWGLPTVDTVLQVTTTRKGAGDIGSKRKRPELFLAEVRQGRFLAAEGGHGEFYGLSKADLKAALLTGKRIALSCGPELAQGLMQDIGALMEEMGRAASPRPIFKLVYLQADKGVVTANLRRREQETKERTKGESEGREEERIKNAEVMLDALEARMKGAENVAVVPLAAGESRAEALLALWGQKETIAAEPELPEVKVSSPRVEVVLRKLLIDLVDAVRKATRSPNPDQLELELTAAMGATLRQVLREIFRAEHGRNPISPAEDVTDDAAAEVLDPAKIKAGKAKPAPTGPLLWWILNHVILTQAVGVEGQMQPVAYDAEGKPRFGALYDQADAERTEGNLKRVGRLFQKVGQEGDAEEKRQGEEAFLLKLLHDIGKLGRAVRVVVGIAEDALGSDWPHNHERNTYLLLTGLCLVRDFFAPRERKEKEQKEMQRRVFELVLKHHHLIGNCFQGAGSPLLFVELLADPEFLRLMNVSLSKDEEKQKDEDQQKTLLKKRTEILERFFDRLLYLTLADVAGQRGTGYLSDLRVEYYFRIREKMEGILKETAKGRKAGDLAVAEWMAEAKAKIQEFSQQELGFRLAAMVYPLSRPGKIGRDGEDLESGLGQYRDLWVEPSRQQAEAAAVFSAEDWAAVQRELQREVFPYADLYLLGGDPRKVMAEGDLAGVTAADLPQTPVHPNLLKYLAVCSRVVEAVTPLIEGTEQQQKAKPVEFVMVEKGGRPTTADKDKMGQAKFFSALTRTFGLRGERAGTTLTAKGDTTFEPLKRPERPVTVFSLGRGEEEIEFLVDKATLGPGHERVAVFVRPAGAEWKTTEDDTDEKIEAARERAALEKELVRSRHAH